MVNGPGNCLEAVMEGRYFKGDLCSLIIILYRHFVIKYIVQLSTQLYNFITLGTIATNQNNNVLKLKKLFISCKYEIIFSVNEVVFSLL